jgi:hypothetical protein
MSIKIMTIFCDIDGCLVEHTGDMTKQMESSPALLPGVKEKLVEWERAGYKIILTTGRRESLRGVTEAMLVRLGVFFDQLIMGLPRGPRLVINDFKPNDLRATALAWCPVRNRGLKECPY